MNPSIHRATLDDLDAASRLFNAYRQFYGQRSDAPAARAFLQERIERQQSMILLALDDNGEAIGFVQMYPMFSSVRMAPVWVLNDLYVDQSVRRTGVGLLLLDAAATAARAGGAVRIVLETAVENGPARALYRIADWEEEATQWYALDLLPLEEPSNR